MLTAGTLRRSRSSLPVGAAVWAAGYCVLMPLAGVLPPAWRDSGARQAALLAAHLFFGAALRASSSALRCGPSPVDADVRSARCRLTRRVADQHRIADAISSAAPALPSRAVIRQHWRDAVFLHWRIDPAEVAPWLPAGTRPDTTPDGATWVGLIPFVLERTAFPPLPVVPWLGTFVEVNVRLYAVDPSGRRSVVFRSLDAQHLLPVLAARIGLGLPYRWARMRGEHVGDLVSYDSERLEGAPVRTAVRVRVEDGAVTDDPVADFLTARWAMHVAHLGRTRYWRNEHEAWPLQRARLLHLEDELLAAAGFPDLAGRTPDSVLFSSGVTTRFSGPA